MILFLTLTAFALIIGALAWRRATWRAGSLPADDGAVRAFVEQEYADSEALVFRYLELFTDEPGPAVRSEKALPAPKEVIKRAILKTMAVEHTRGALSEQRLNDYRSLYVDLAHFGSEAEAAKSAALYLARAQFKASADRSPSELLAISRVVGSYHEVDFLALKQVELRNDFTSRWQRMLSVTDQ
jgi:hypothetical protein